jgi:hypothetical protein
MIGLDQKRRYFLYAGATDIRKNFEYLRRSWLRQWSMG